MQQLNRRKDRREEVLCSATFVSCCKDDDYDDSGEDDGDVNSNVCKCSLLGGLLWHMSPGCRKGQS